MNARPHDDTTTDRLWSLAMGIPDPDMETHLATCETCQHEYDTLRALASYRETTGGALVEPPPQVQAMATSLLRQVRPDLVRAPESLAERAGNALRRLVANLAYDSSTTALAGVRSDTDRQTRQLAFVSDLGDLDLMVTARDSRSEINGQLGLDDMAPDLVLHFTPAEPDPAVEPVSLPLPESGQFTVTLPRGEWVAWVRIGDAILEFPGVRV